MRKAMLFLVVGVVIFIIGLCLNIRYEDHSLVVEATVTHIKTKDSTDGDYRHVYYGEYTVDGKTYKDQKLTADYSGTEYDTSMSVGDTYEMRVNPNKPARKMMEGGFFGVVGLLMAVYGGIQVHRYRKAEKENIS